MTASKDGKYWKEKRYRPIVTVKKVKSEVPTVIKASGKRYVLDNKN